MGDCDTSSFKEAVKSNSCSKFGIVLEKVECVGHVQRQLGTRLRNMVKEYKGKTTLLSGKGKLTEKVINYLQNFYGIAIRQNSGTLCKIKKAVCVILCQI